MYDTQVLPGVAILTVPPCAVVVLPRAHMRPCIPRYLEIDKFCFFFFIIGGKRSIFINVASLKNAWEGR
jgi:hypothetical protein